MKSTHLLCGRLLGAFFTVKLGIFEILAYPPGGIRARKINKLIRRRQLKLTTEITRQAPHKTNQERWVSFLFLLFLLCCLPLLVIRLYLIKSCAFKQESINVILLSFILRFDYDFLILSFFLLLLFFSLFFFLFHLLFIHQCHQLLLLFFFIFLLRCFGGPLSDPHLVSIWDLFSDLPPPKYNPPPLKNPFWPKMGRGD